TALTDLESGYFHMPLEQREWIDTEAKVIDSGHVLPRAGEAFRMSNDNVVSADMGPGQPAATPLPIDIKVALYGNGPLQRVASLFLHPGPQAVPIESGDYHDQNQQHAD